MLNSSINKRAYYLKSNAGYYGIQVIDFILMINPTTNRLFVHDTGGIDKYYILTPQP